MVLGLIGFAPFTPIPADLPDSIRCGNRLVDLGLTRVEVQARCGDPTDKVDYSKYSISHVRHLGDKVRRSFPYDRFVMEYSDYTSFLKQKESIPLSHDHEHLLALLPELRTQGLVRRDAYSVRRMVLPGYDPGDLSAYQIFWKCQVVQQEISEWVYNLGPTQFIRILTFSNGRLIKIEHGDYGY